MSGPDFLGGFDLNSLGFDLVIVPAGFTAVTMTGEQFRADLAEYGVQAVTDPNASMATRVAQDGPFLIFSVAGRSLIDPDMGTAARFLFNPEGAAVFIAALTAHMEELGCIDRMNATVDQVMPDIRRHIHEEGEDGE